MSRKMLYGLLLAIVVAFPTASWGGWKLPVKNDDAKFDETVTVSWTINGDVKQNDASFTLGAGKSKDIEPPQHITIRDPDDLSKLKDLGAATDYVLTTISEKPGSKQVKTEGLVKSSSAPNGVGDINDIIGVFPVGTAFILPTPMATDSNLFAGIDLGTYIPSALITVPSSIDIVNGRSPLLPGYLIGTTDVTFDSTLGFVTSSPFTGTLGFDNSVSISSVPEPPALTLGIVAISTLAGYWVLRRRVKLGPA